MVKEFHQFKAHVKRLLQEFDFIKNLDSVVQNEIAEITTHVRRKAGDVLWKQGDVANDGCYVLLEGEIEGFLDDPSSSFGEPVYEQGSKMIWRHAHAIVALIEDGVEVPTETTEPAEEEKRRIRREKFKSTESTRSAWSGSLGPAPVVQRSFGVGSMFGQIALLENRPRFYTMKCKSDVELLHISKSDFDRLMKSAINQIRFRQLSGPMRAFLREFDFYKKLNNAQKVRVPEIMTYQRFREGSVVFREGDEPRSVFILLTGSVLLYRKSVEEDTDTTLSTLDTDLPLAPRRSKAESTWANMGVNKKLKAAAMLARLHEREDYGHQCNWVKSEIVDLNDDNHGLGGLLSTLGPGSLFGELALVENVPRCATVVCSTGCEMLCVDKAGFDLLLKSTIAEAHMALPELVEPLLAQVPFFQNLRPAVRSNSAYSMRYYVEQQGQVLFWEGEPPGNCYLILSGEVAVWKKDADENEDVLQKAKVLSGDAELKEQCQKLGKHLADLKKPMHMTDLVKTAKAMKLKEEANQEAMEKRLAGEPEKKCGAPRVMTDILGIQLATLQPGIVFGEQALLNDAPRNATVTCTDTCQLLVICREDFDRVVKQDLLRNKVRQLSGAIKRLLREFDLFKELSQNVQEHISEIVHYSKVREGTTLFEQGDAPNYCYIILSGEVTVWARREMADIDGGDSNTRKATDSSENIPSRKNTDQIEEGDTSGTRQRAGTQDRGSRPDAESACALARERCATLAAMLSNLASFGMSTQEGAAASSGLGEDDTMIQYTCQPVASLGSGTLFGELALLNDKPRGATISCWSDCEFLVIEKMDFDRLLKAELNNTKKEKLEFLRTHVPGVRTLSATIAERLLYYFHKIAVPKNHVFIRQGSLLQGDIYFVWEGAVESYSNLPQGGRRQRGILLKGSIFGAVPINTTASFSVIATSSACEVLHVKPADRKHIPESVLSCLGDFMERTLARRMVQCAPLMPMMPDVNNFQRPASQSSKTTRCKERRRRTCLMPSSASGESLFQRGAATSAHHAFDLSPGETIAMEAQRPQRRDMDKISLRLGSSLSAPSLRGLAGMQVRVN